MKKKEEGNKEKKVCSEEDLNLEEIVVNWVNFHGDVKWLGGGHMEMP